MTTEIVYVINPDYLAFLRLSLDSLLRSGSKFDSIRVYCVGGTIPEWKLPDQRIVLEKVLDLNPQDFLWNKTHMTKSSADRLVFLDADTLVLSPVEKVYANSNKDFLARIANPYLRSTWNHADWMAVCARLNSVPAPYFNSGFMVFQNASHRRIDKLWPKIISVGASQSLFDPAALHVNPRYHDQRYLEQLSLSLSVASSGLSWEEMTPSDHSWAWNQEPYAEATVFHTAGPRFLALAEKIYRERGLSDAFARIVQEPCIFP
jgi:hypothetical protein